MARIGIHAVSSLNPHPCGFLLNIMQHIRKYHHSSSGSLRNVTIHFSHIKILRLNCYKVDAKNLKKLMQKTWKSCWQILFIVIVYTSRLKNGRRKIKKFVEFLKNLKKVIDRVKQTWYSIGVAVKKERQRRMKQWTLKTKQYKPNPEKFKWIFRWFKSSLRIVWCESDISKQQ